MESPPTSAPVPDAPAAPRSRRVVVVGAVAAFVVAVLVVTLAVFQPQRLFLDVEVDERLPDLVVAPGAGGEDHPMTPETPDAPTAVARGDFVARAHPTSGTALLVRRPDGSHLVRFEQFRTDNGPDVRVALSPAPAGSGDYAGLMTLGPLKGNVGDQNYEIPGDVDLARVRAVVVWCERFDVAFGEAPLAPR